MKIARVQSADGGIAYGLVESESIHLFVSSPAGNLEQWLASGILKNVAAGPVETVRLADVRLLSPIVRPPKYLALGGNFASHLREIEHLGIPAPDHQIWFNKQSTCVVGPNDDCAIPSLSKAVDYEGELGVVIGSRCRHVPAAQAHEVIAGYVVCNDVSARDIQMRTQTMTLGKSFDTHGPIGPWLVTPDEIPDCQKLGIRTFVNGELRQDGSTSEMRYSVAEQIEHLSQVFTLEPGDILATGTPSGVGAAAQPPRFLKAGDIVRVEIEKIGVIENRFVSENTETIIETTR